MISKGQLSRIGITVGCRSLLYCPLGTYIFGAETHLGAGVMSAFVFPSVTIAWSCGMCVNWTEPPTIIRVAFEPWMYYPCFERGRHLRAYRRKSTMGQASDLLQKYSLLPNLCILYFIPSLASWLLGYSWVIKSFTCTGSWGSYSSIA